MGYDPREVEGARGKDDTLDIEWYYKIVVIEEIQIFSIF